MKLSPRLAAVLAVAVGVALVTGCDPESSVAKPTPVAATQAPATVAVQSMSLTERQDRTYFACAAPVYGLHVSYDAAKAAAPDELNTVISSGRTLYSAYTDLPLSVDDAIKAADLTD
ncbi:hypothetical protein, partial [Gordonia aichiensis]